jgi:hypothetical protein
MAISFVNSASATPDDAAGTTMATVAANHTSGNLLVVGMVHTGASAATGVTDTAGNTYFDTGIHVVHGTDRIDLWYAKNITGHASNVVTVAYASSTFRRCMVLQYSGADPVTPYVAASGGSFQTASAVTTGTTSTWTASAANELIVCFASSTNAQTYSGVGNVRFASNGTDSGAVDNITTNSAGTTQSATINDSSASGLWIVAGSFAPAATSRPRFRARQIRARSMARSGGGFAR